MLRWNILFSYDQSVKWKWNITNYKNLQLYTSKLVKTNISIEGDICSMLIVEHRRAIQW